MGKFSGGRAGGFPPAGSVAGRADRLRAKCSNGLRAQEFEKNWQAWAQEGRCFSAPPLGQPKGDMNGG
jgi:hypothetical protein